MNPLSWFAAICTQFQLPYGWKFKVHGGPNEEKKDGQTSPGEQHTGNPTEAEACTVPSEKDGETTPCSRPLAEKSSRQKSRRKDATVKPERQQAEANADPPSARQLEEAKGQLAELTDEVKTEKQLALGLLTFSAGAVISAKSTTFAKQPAAGGQGKAQHGFFFWASIALWFTCLLISLFTVLLTTFRRKSAGLVIYSKIINHFNMCITVIGVAFWIFS